MSSAPLASDTAQAPGRAVRAIVSVLVMLHVAAVFLGPFATPPQTSELAMRWGRTWQPYLDFLSLSNGYRFFAPEPGPSHLVRYELTMDDGSRREGVFPDRMVHKPRLLYHRYFMLSEFLNTLGAPGLRDRGEAYAKSYAEHLASEYHAKTVKLFLRRHYVPRMNEVQQGMRLTNKALYEEHPLGVFERDKT